MDPGDAEFLFFCKLLQIPHEPAGDLPEPAAARADKMGMAARFGVVDFEMGMLDTPSQG